MVIGLVFNRIDFQQFQVTNSSGQFSQFTLEFNDGEGGIRGYGYGYYQTLPVPENFRVPYLKSRVTGKVGYGYYPWVP